MIAKIYHRLYGLLDTDSCANNPIFSLSGSMIFINKMLCHLQELSHFRLQRNAARNRLLAQLSLVETFLQKSAALQPASKYNKQTNTEDIKWEDLS